MLLLDRAASKLGSSGSTRLVKLALQGTLLGIAAGTACAVGVHMVPFLVLKESFVLAAGIGVGVVVGAVWGFIGSFVLIIEELRRR